MKRLIILLLSALMSMIGLKAFAHDIEVANNDGVTIYYIWANEAKTELAVSWCGLYYESHYDYIGNVIIPESVEYNGNTYPVTSIGGNAFYGCSGLTSITIPNSVTSIGWSAFRDCSGLRSVTIPNSVTSIGGRVFYGCSGLTSVTIPNSVTYIGDYAFLGCSGLTSVTIPNSVTEIRDGVFRDCGGLTSVTIPNSVTDIGSEAFYGCGGLTSVTIPNSVTDIGKNAFAYCSLTSVKVPVTDYSAFCNNKHIDFIRRAIGKPVQFQLIDIKEAEITEYIVPDDVTSIGRSAFSGCSGLTSVSIPNSVTSIGSEAFSGCSGLTSVIIGSGVLSIGSSAFSNTNLKKTIWLTNTPPSGYNYAKGTVNYVSNDQFNIDNKIVYKFLSSIFVVDGIRYVPVSPSDRTCDAIDCLYNESSENVNIGQTITNKGITLIVKKVNPYTCYGNNFIKEVNLSLGGDIGENAFWGCNALNTATINNQGHIGEKSFSGCTALNTLTISNQGDIGADAFSGCESISSLQGY